MRKDKMRTSDQDWQYIDPSATDWLEDQELAKKQLKEIEASQKQAENDLVQEQERWSI